MAIAPRTMTVLGDRWEIGAGEYGDPLVFHRHLAESVPAYVIGGGPEHRFAMCSECREYLEFAERTGEPPYALV